MAICRLFTAPFCAAGQPVNLFPALLSSIIILPDLRYLSAVLLRAPAHCLPDFTAHAVNFPVDFRNGQRLFTALFRHQFRYAVFRRRDFSSPLRYHAPHAASHLSPAASFRG